MTDFPLCILKLNGKTFSSHTNLIHTLIKEYFIQWHSLWGVAINNVDWENKPDYCVACSFLREGSRQSSDCCPWLCAFANISFGDYSIFYDMVIVLKATRRGENLCLVLQLVAEVAEESERWERPTACKRRVWLPPQSQHPDQKWQHRWDRLWFGVLRALLSSNRALGYFKSPFS